MDAGDSDEVEKERTDTFSANFATACCLFNGPRLLQTKYRAPQTIAQCNTLHPQGRTVSQLNDVEIPQSQCVLWVCKRQICGFGGRRSKDDKVTEFHTNHRAQ